MSDEGKKEIVDEGTKDEGTKDEGTKTPEEVIEENKVKSIKEVEKILNPPEKEFKDKEKAEAKEKEALEADKKSTEEVDDGSTPKDEEDEKSTPKDEEEESETTKKVDEEVKKLSLPNRLLLAAKRNHISNQDILDYGDKAGNILTRFADSSDKVSIELGALGRIAKQQALLNPKKEANKPTLKIEENEDDSDEVKELKSNQNFLTEQIAELRGALVDEQRKSDESVLVERADKIDSFFDSKAGEFPEFGSLKTLTQVQDVMRRTVWETADDIMTGAKVSNRKISLEQALEQAFSIYESKTPKKKISREKILDEVKKRENHFSSRPKSKKSTASVVADKKKAIAAVNKILHKEEEGWD